MRLGLKFAILSSGKTQRQIALETELLNENRLSEIVRGWASPRADEREALSHVLRQPMVALFGDEAFQERASPAPSAGVRRQLRVER